MIPPPNGTNSMYQRPLVQVAFLDNKDVKINGTNSKYQRSMVTTPGTCIKDQRHHFQVSKNNVTTSRDQRPMVQPPCMKHKMVPLTQTNGTTRGT